MAKHGKKRIFLKPFIAVLSAVLVFASLCAVFAYSGALDTVATLFNYSYDTAPDSLPSSTTQSTATTTNSPQLPPVQHAVPEEMKGVWFTPGVDYLTTKTPTVKTLKDQIDTAFSDIEEWDFNTVLLPLFKENVAVYPSKLAESFAFTQTDGTVFDPITYILEKAREKKLFVYGVLDLQVRVGGDWDPRTEDGKNRIVKLAEEVAATYSMDGFFVSGFTFSGKQTEGREEEAKKSLDELMPLVTKAITTANRNAYLGLLSNGIWAHQSVDERGSETAEYYEEFTDGCADTLSWVQQGLFNCVMAGISTSTSHPTAAFQKILSWWSSVAEKQQIPLYVSHAADEAGSYRSGWKSTDQLAQQYLYCQDSAAWKGSVYRSLHDLTKDKTGISDALKRAYDGTLDEEYIYKQLTLSFPTKTSHTTKESSLVFQGGGDKNFPITVNGKSVEMSEHGFFSLNCPLSVGKNTFVFSHKGTTKTYTIIYEQTLVSAVSPSDTMNVEGGNVFIIRAVAHKHAAVTATIGTAKLTLTPIGVKEEESGNTPTDFQTFEAKYTLPQGKVGSSVDLGQITVTAKLNGLTQSKTGGSVHINALPQPTTTTTTTATTTQTTVFSSNTLPTGTGTENITTEQDGTQTTVPSGTTAITMPTLPAGDKKVAQITADYAETFTGGLLDDYSRPYNSYLPKGTYDYVAGTIYNGSYSYYLLASGKRVYMKDATLLQATLPNTTLRNAQTQLTNTHTVISFSADWQIPIYFSAKKQNYYRDELDGTPNYGLENYSQTATYVDIEFHYLSAVPPLPDLNNSPLFSKATWIAGAKSGVYILRLDLKKQGAFYGCSPRWEGGTLTLSFLNPANISQNETAQRLKGVRILLDPGHGTSDDKPWEAPFNLAYANTLREKLEALGATVDMTRTAPLTNKLTLQERVKIAQGQGYHMVISVHMNGSNGLATGATVHYYTEQSYTPSSIIYKKMHEVEIQEPYKVGVGSHARASGTVWGTLYMTRSISHCPSVLLECAFLDNPKDKEALVDPIYRDKLMQAVTDGVVEYFNAM